MLFGGDDQATMVSVSPLTIETAHSTYGGGCPSPLTREVRPYIAPRYETDDERYAWINKIQAVAKNSLVMVFSITSSTMS